MTVSRRTLPGWLLIILLLAGQASLLVHESIHDLGSADVNCEVCLKNAGFKGACPPPAVPPLLHHTAAPAPAGEAVAHGGGCLPGDAAPRAPPSLS